MSPWARYRCKRRADYTLLHQLTHDRRCQQCALLDEIPEERSESSRGQAKQGGIKRKMSKFKLRHRGSLSRKPTIWH